MKIQNIEIIPLEYIARKKSHNMIALYQSYQTNTQRIFISADTRKDTADFMQFKSTLEKHNFIFLKYLKPNMHEIIEVAKTKKHIFLIVPHYLQKSVTNDLANMLEDLA